MCSKITSHDSDSVGDHRVGPFHLDQRWNSHASTLACVNPFKAGPQQMSPQHGTMSRFIIASHCGQSVLYIVNCQYVITGSCSFIVADLPWSLNINAFALPFLLVSWFYILYVKYKKCMSLCVHT